ncbi:nuclear pore protein 84/107 [Multifurca ochricompacta]|uniref:Nuclear pore complex protein n=1 Tax=Multifurca ochricompacta TaxID=376703 RepID=A0AAD4LZ20_9AGAM|nr:nuclear pore protein 84/107 [Multifurca ochricompacta]
MSETFYTSCADILALCQAQNNNLEALLDPQTGFAPRLRQLCEQQLSDLREEGNASPEEIEALRMECSTWALLQAIIPARKTEPPLRPSARALLAANPYTPTSALAQAMMAASRTLSELVVVREWLHDTAPPPPHPDASNGYWRLTKNRVMQGRWTGNAGRAADSVVRDMDPDAVVREAEVGHNLAADDASYDKALSHTLFSYVRAGNIEDAVRLCRDVHQPWRAASIRGSLLFSWPAISTTRQDDAAENEEEGEDEDEDDPDLWHGNKQRALWKTTCTRAALDARLSSAERALYAALAPSVRTSSVLRSGCRTWEDALWATISVLCEERQSEALARIGGGFWEPSGRGGEEGEEVVGEVAEEEEDAWRADVEQALQALATAQVQEGLGADDPFHISQLHIILDRTDALLDDFATRLRDGAYDPDSSEYPTMTRFFAHLCLYLQMIDIPVSPLAIQVILEAYLQVLESAGQRSLIAMYAGALGDNAVERYALFLTSLALSADPAERRVALQRAREHGLDVPRVAVVTAERTIERALDGLPSSVKGPLPDLAKVALIEPAEEAEILLVRSIEWTVVEKETYDTALEQANVILRYLLARGRVNVARSLLDMLPPELTVITTPEERAAEYLDYRQFFIAWETLERVVESGALVTPQMSRDTRAAWLKDYTSLVSSAQEKILKLLTTDWLVAEAETPSGMVVMTMALPFSNRIDHSVIRFLMTRVCAPDRCRQKVDRRARELARIRQLFVPELILRLHDLLVSSRTHIPE